MANPLEPLIVSLLKGFVDDADLSKKLQALYKARHIQSWSDVWMWEGG